MPSRARIRTGRRVSYNPIATEVTASGAGPWAAQIADVNADGSVDLFLIPPGDALGVVGAALASPLIAAADIAAVVVTPPPTPANAAYVQAEATATADSIAELQTIAATLLTAVNELKADLNIAATLINQLRGLDSNQRKGSVLPGSTVGTYSFDGVGAGPDTV